MNNRRRIIGILVAVFLATVGTMALVGYVQSAKDEAVGAEELVDVYVVATAVPKGADPDTIKSAVSIDRVPARLVQPGAILDLDEVGANVAAADLLPGDQLLAARLVAPEAVAEEVTDKVQISARLAAERAVGGLLEQGDLVGVYISFDSSELDATGQASDQTDQTDTTTPEDGSVDTLSAEQPAEQSPNMTRLEFQQVLVTSVQSTNAPVTVEGTEPAGIVQVSAPEYVVTLALSPEQSERFVFAAEFGRVWLSLQPASVSDDGTRLVTLGTVFSVLK